MKKLWLLLLLTSCGVSHVSKNSNSRDSTVHDSTYSATKVAVDSSRKSVHDSTEKVSTHIPEYLSNTPLGRFYDSLNTSQELKKLPIYLPGETITRYVKIHDANEVTIKKLTSTIYVHTYSTRLITKVITKVKTTDTSILKNIGWGGVVLLILGALFFLWLKLKPSIIKSALKF